MPLTPVLHAAFAAVWLGLAVTEAFFERAFAGRGRAARLTVSRIHKWVDLLIEVPLFAGVAVTGGLMLRLAPHTPWIDGMIALGTLAIVANGLCVWIVLRRADAAEADDVSAYERYDLWQHRIGVIVLVSVTGALVCGLIGR